MNGVAMDLAPHPEERWAVIINGLLLPVRFATQIEAVNHLGAMAYADLSKQAREQQAAAEPQEATA